MAEPDYNQYLAEMQASLRAQQAVLPEQAAAEMRLSPMFQQVQLSGLQNQAQGLLGMYGGDMYGQSQALQQRYAGDQLTMMGGLAPQATQAAIGSLDPTTRGIYGAYGQQALSDLQMGSSLNAQETNQAQQAARAAAQSRGMNFSRQGSDLEVLNTYNMGQKRLQQRQAVAQSAYQMGAGQQQIGLSGFLSPAMQGASSFSLPGIFGQSQQSYGQLGQSSFLQPESQYLANIRANRIQQENANAAAEAQKSAGMFGGFGQIAGAAIGAYAKFGCWVAREVYGNDNPKWLVFRAWLSTEAPVWLKDLYMEEGERFASYISDKPILKRIVKCAMDLVVNPRYNKLAVYS